MSQFRFAVGGPKITKIRDFDIMQQAKVLALENEKQARRAGLSFYALAKNGLKLGLKNVPFGSH